MADRNSDDMVMLLTPFENKEHLQAWIFKFLNITMPDQTVSRFADSNPLDFIWECYTAMRDGKALGVMALAGRSSGKTLALSIIDLISFVIFNRQAIHLAMTTAQAGRAKEYLASFLHGNPLLESMIVEENSKIIRLNINNKVVGMEILPATPRAVQGARCSILSIDELGSSMMPDNIKAVRDSHAILTSTRADENGVVKPGIIIKITSRHAGHTLAEQELKNAAKSGLEIRRWTTLETTMKCEDDRSGTISTPLWINVNKGIVLSESEFSQVQDNRKQEFELTKDTFDKCRQCPVASICQGDLKKQLSDSTILRTVDDLISTVRLAGSVDWTLAQIMSLKPSMEGAVFWEYDRQTHVPGWDGMWKKLTGAEPTTSITREIFVQKLKSQGSDFYAGCDFGWTDPTVLIVVAIDKNENIYVIDSLVRTHTTPSEFANLINKFIMPKYPLQMIAPDIANPSGIHEFKLADLPVTSEVDKSIKFGLNVIKGFLRVAGTNNDTKILFAPDLAAREDAKVPGILEEMELYHMETDKTGKILDDLDPADELNHSIDSLRYILTWLFGKAGMKSVFAGRDGFSPTLAGATSNTPVKDLVRISGVQFTDNRAEFDENGRPINGDDDDPNKPKGGKGGLQYAWT